MPNELVLVGSGGHAKVIIDIIQQNGIYKVIGCTSVHLNQQHVMGVPILGDDSMLPGIFQNGVRNAFVALGDNRLRERVLESVCKLGFGLVNAISKFAYVAPSVKLGRNIAIMSGAVINPDTIVKDNAIINTGTTIDHDNLIERSVHVAPGSSLAGNVTVRQGSFLGIGCKVIPNTTIGEWCTVGAGAVVIRNLPAHSLAVGVPARIIEK